MMTRTLLLQMAGSRKMEHFARHNRIAASLAQRFIAGEKLEDITAPVRALNQQGMSVSLDFLGESVSFEAETAEVTDTYLRLFQHIRAEALNANVSVKLTSLGLDIADALAERNLLRILQAAGPEMFVRVDMEGSPHTQRTLNLFYRIWNSEQGFRNTGIVLQSYLHRSAEDVEDAIRAGVRVRLCKGAYREGPEVAFQEKSEVDASFVRLMQRLLTEGNYPGIATHDTNMIDAVKEFARQKNISTDRYEFQMLFGVRRELQEQLVQQGYRLRIYTPFGEHWYPYTMRRLAERPANLRFALTSMVRG